MPKKKKERKAKAGSVDVESFAGSARSPSTGGGGSRPTQNHNSYKGYWDFSKGGRGRRRVITESLYRTVHRKPFTEIGREEVRHLLLSPKVR